MVPDRPLFGIFLMLGFCIIAPISDGLAKLLGGQTGLGQLLFMRFGIQGLLLLPVMYASGRAWNLRGFVLYMAIARTFVHLIAIGAMFTALQYLPLADAIAIAFVMPFLMLILGKLFLGEGVGKRRLWACAVGFVGTLMVMQPNFLAVGWPALLPLFVAVNFSVFMLITRRIAKETDPIGLQAFSGVLGAFIIGMLWVFDLDVTMLEFRAPGAMGWFLLLMIGVLGTLAHLLMTWSLRYAPSATLAPMQYLEIPVATLIGYLMFGDFPGGIAAAGIIVIISAGLYIVFKERALARRAVTSAPTPG